MKFKLLLLILILWQTGQSQIVVGQEGFKKVKEETFQRFKKTKTIFILPDVYDKATYDSILKTSWHVTPYEIVRNKDFNLNDYGGNQYSYVRITPEKHTLYRDVYSESNGHRVRERWPMGFLVYAYFEFYMYDFDKMKKQLEEISPKQIEKKKLEIIEKNKTKMAQFMLYLTEYFDSFFKKNSIKDIEQQIYREADFYNYKLGFLKNYFQKISNLIQNEQHYWSYRRKYLPELANLKNKTLYVPEYIAMKYVPSLKRYEKPNEAYLNEIFKDYEFKYQMIDADVLSQKILKNEPIYYFLLVRSTLGHYFEIVNAQTGEFVFDNYKRSSTTKAMKKFIKRLNKYIKKAAKK